MLNLHRWRGPLHGSCAPRCLASRVGRARWQLGVRTTASSTGAAASNSASSALPPTWTQLWRHALVSAVPMVGFGFMDNLVMIQAGDYIDSTIGVAFTMSTLTAAAYGQVVSDMSGVLSGGVVEAMAARIGLPKANLTVEQLGMRSVKNAGVAGAMVGVMSGCLLGMLSLLFMDLEKTERLKKQKELRTMYNSAARPAPAPAPLRTMRSSAARPPPRPFGGAACDLFRAPPHRAAPRRSLSSPPPRGRDPSAVRPRVWRRCWGPSDPPAQPSPAQSAALMDEAHTISIPIAIPIPIPIPIPDPHPHPGSPQR